MLLAGVQIAIGEDFLYCVKAAGFAYGSAADPDRSLSVGLQAAGDERKGADAATFPSSPGRRLFPDTGLEPTRCSWEPDSEMSPLASSGTFLAISVLVM